MRSRQVQGILSVLDALAALCAPFAAALLRQWMEDDRTISVATGYLPYALGSAVATLLFLRWMGVARSTWRFFSYPDSVRAAQAIGMGVAVGLLIGFSQDRLDSVARSVPFIHLALQSMAFVGARIIARRLADKSITKPKRPAGVIVLGCNATAETYVRAVEQLSGGSVQVLALLADDRTLVGQTLRGKRIMATLGEAEDVVSTLKVHGHEVARFIMAVPPQDMPDGALAALENFAAANGAQIISIHSLFSDVTSHEADESQASEAFSWTGGYWPFKRALDITLAISILLLTVPLMIAVAALTFIDVRTPLIFWQNRLGRNGRNFTLYKFRTMGAPKGPDGHAVPDALRMSSIGKFLRKTRLDELPQLFNILEGTMSFVGPRPLLPVDQPEDTAERLSVRPGLSGWAQVNGGKLVDPEEKRALDLWYVSNASLWIDVKIAWLTLAMFARGDIRNEAEIARATRWVARRTPRPTQNDGAANEPLASPAESVPQHSHAPTMATPDP